MVVAANFPAEITLKLKTEGVLRKIKQVETALGNALAGDKKTAKLEKQLAKLEAKQVRINNQRKKANIQELNDTSKIIRLFKQAKQIRGSYAKDAERAAKSAEKEQRAVERTAALNKKKRSNRLEGLALGGGFPLLFGGGIGQSLAGLAGAGLGPALGLGSMGGGIAFQAVAATITQATTALTETAAVAGSVGDAYDFLTEKSLFASEETQILADKLAELGEVEKLAEAVTQELVNLIGNEGVQNLQKLDDEVDTFQKEIAKLGLAIGSFLSQYLTPLIDKFNSVLGTINTANAFETRRKEITGTDREAEFNRRVKELSTPGARGSKIFGEAQQKILLEEFPAIVETESLITPTLEDRKRFTPPKTGGGAGKKPYDPTKRIADLTAEAALIKKIAEQDRQINEAQVARQNLLVIQLKLTKDLDRIEADRLKAIRNSKAPDAERAAINKVAAAKAAAAETRAEGETYKFLKQNEESTARKIELMGKQTELADALTREEQNQLKLQIGLLQLREANKGKSEEQLAALEQGFRKLFAAQNLNPIEAYVRKLETSLTDVEARVVQTAQIVENALASGFSSAITGIIDGTKSVEEAFADMFSGIAKAFLDMATKILAQKLMLTVLKAFGGGGAAAAGGGDIFSQLTSQGYTFAGGGYTGDAPRTGGIDGQGGFPAILHPQETVVDHYGDARSAMSNSASASAAFAESAEAMAMANNNYAYNSASNSYSNSNSSSVTANNPGASGSSGSTTIQVQTQVINEVEYATVAELNKGMQLSAKQAEANVYRGMRNRPATRNRVGV